MEITEESKALLEEYNKTVSFPLSWALRSAVWSLAFIPFLVLSLNPSQPVCLFPSSPYLCRGRGKHLSSPSLRFSFSP